jgi:hypothetical protein
LTFLTRFRIFERFECRHKPLVFWLAIDHGEISFPTTSVRERRAPPAPDRDYPAEAYPDGIPKA